jgi:hypothetical protein
MSSNTSGAGCRIAGSDTGTFTDVAGAFVVGPPAANARLEDAITTIDAITDRQLLRLGEHHFHIDVPRRA